MTARRIHLLRHGPPEVQGLLIGRTDVAPTAGGIARCVDRVADIPIDAIVASDLTRVRDAAAAIAGPRNLPCRLDARWRELDFGAWDGLAIGAIDAAATAAFWADPDANPPPGGERWSAMVERVGTALEVLDDRATLVVTHGGAIRAALAHLCGFDHHQVWTVDLPYCALLSLDVWPGPPEVTQMVGLRT